MPNIILHIEKPSDKIHKSDNICCYCLSASLDKTKFDEAVATGKMVLVEGVNALNKCKEYNLDGVVIKIDTSKPLKPQVKSLREALKKKTLGIIIPARRHEAMLAGETEPEFIGFYSNDKSKDDEIISWYNELFLMPLAWVCDGKNDKEKQNKVEFMIISSENF